MQDYEIRLAGLGDGARSDREGVLCTFVIPLLERKHQTLWYDRDHSSIYVHSICRS